METPAEATLPHDRRLGQSVAREISRADDSVKPPAILQHKHPLAYLQEAGAHFVLCVDKLPIWRGWQHRRPTAEVAIAHRGQIGLMPASIGTTGLDVDQGDPTQLLAHHPAWADLPSRRKGGHHLYYQDDTPRANAQWAAYGAAGQVRSGRGYLVLWNNGAAKLVQALQRGPSGVPYPADLPLFAASGLPVPAQTYAPPATRREVEALQPVTVEPLETVLPGRRNVALFDATRWWAYVAWHAHRGDMADWHEAVAERAHSNNERFPDPLPEAEVTATAYSISTWVASGGGPSDHSPKAQARRGRVSGLVRRGVIPSKRPGDRGSRRTGKLRSDVYLRDQAIIADRAAGMLQREIAERHGVTQGWVSRVLRRANIREPYQ